VGLLGAATGAIAAAGALAGAGGGSVPLAKLRIWVQVADGGSNTKWDPVDVLFNPSTLTKTQATNWQHTPNTQEKNQMTQFTGFSLDKLKLDLFFDTTEEGSPDQPVDVRTYTSKILRLTRMLSVTHCPPFCRFEWGKGFPHGEPLLLGVATQIDQELNYFHIDGTPLRATLHCQFEQFLSWGASSPGASKTPPAGQTSSNDLHKAYVVKQGDTLASIAYTQMHSAALWKEIAIANGITDPLSLKPGQLLHIPTVDRW
jgi:Contractile injection system tube protein/LysM domain